MNTATNGINDNFGEIYKYLGGIRGKMYFICEWFASASYDQKHAKFYPYHVYPTKMLNLSILITYAKNQCY
jgi:hypothetical protein